VQNHLKNKTLRNSLVTASQAWSVIHDRKKLWREKTGRDDPFEGNDATAWGNDKEKFAIDAFEKEMNCITDFSDELIVHPELPLAGTPDFFYDGCPGEVKCPYSMKVYPTIPERYYYQCQVQMAITNTLKNYFYIWTPTKTKLEIIPFNKKFMTWYLPYVLEFVEYVRTDQEPPRFSRKPLFKIGD